MTDCIQKIFRCNVGNCDDEYTTRGNLKYHVENYHRLRFDQTAKRQKLENADRILTCDSCGEVGLSSSWLHAHRKQVHHTEKVFTFF